MIETNRPYISNPKSRNIGLNSQSDGSNLQLRISVLRCRIRAISKSPLVRVLHESSMLMPSGRDKNLGQSVLTLDIPKFDATHPRIQASAVRQRHDDSHFIRLWRIMQRNGHTIVV